MRINGADNRKRQQAFALLISTILQSSCDWQLPLCHYGSLPWLEDKLTSNVLAATQSTWSAKSVFLLQQSSIFLLYLQATKMFFCAHNSVRAQLNKLFLPWSMTNCRIKLCSSSSLLTVDIVALVLWCSP